MRCLMPGSVHSLVCLDVARLRSSRYVCMLAHRNAVLPLTCCQTSKYMTVNLPCDAISHVTVSIGTCGGLVTGGCCTEGQTCAMLCIVSGKTMGCYIHHQVKWEGWGGGGFAEGDQAFPEEAGP